MTILIQELSGGETQVAYDTVASATVPNGDAAASQVARRLDIEVLGLLYHATGQAPNCGTSIPRQVAAPLRASARYARLGPHHCPPPPPRAAFTDHGACDDDGG